MHSASLGRDVTVTVLLPPGFSASETYPLVLFNDGQDFEALQMAETAAVLQSAGRIAACVIAGIHANDARIYEYGTARQPDYAGRGDKAGLTTSFVLEELVPYLADHYRTVTTGITYAGFSLGGLMALDAVWNYPAVFSNAGIFSGSLWWRQRALNEGYAESDRIMHRQIRDTEHTAPLNFWFQCGTWDEYDDRDGDGVIDSIQDTLECIAELERKGYGWGREIRYVEVKEGMHNPGTWAKALPDFLVWVSGRAGTH
ncbi:enterochelin esterase-like enzyme [Dyadobacter sp. BE34]|uniref:Enterochelin esterase-like enzyme n=1 Tax=Dyadobacter fermentans TaxID=94254 RepID=A0ABU1QZL8_9BACT|nr:MULTISPECIES: alpha/beta hydrolase-fold protein [Dyadobacter]MDR6806447.1 enterochelin esterase-like enzyme [Dyadobacter fermentans]MDR7044188.1 enterochelin esterase-like enzyme [Dyadobacter sp. BE242]MDR7198499.1 enterochelin esterase-like enzyme [Dyadobacter sp. BE34]MDR7216461.1 enterochelin esterase-like enzyme [Dyadobacter sp. BE31]MDR7264012.1 enterochelin esterase-like enzyme [Dyadobacter sp. BE32]